MYLLYLSILFWRMHYLNKHITFWKFPTMPRRYWSIKTHIISLFEILYYSLQLFSIVILEIDTYFTKRINVLNECNFTARCELVLKRTKFIHIRFCFVATPRLLGIFFRKFSSWRNQTWIWKIPVKMDFLIKNCLTKSLPKMLQMWTYKNFLNLMN